MTANQTPLEALERDIEAAAFALAADVLFNHELTRHTRRGHKDCDCEYCVAKKHATFDVGNAARSISWGTIPSRSNRDVHSFGSCGVTYHDDWLLKYYARERVRKEVRTRLQALIDKD